MVLYFRTHQFNLILFVFPRIISTPLFSHFITEREIAPKTGAKATKVFTSSTKS